MYNRYLLRSRDLYIAYSHVNTYRYVSNFYTISEVTYMSQLLFNFCEKIVWTCLNLH